jgi:cytochrome c5
MKSAIASLALATAIVTIPHPGKAADAAAGQAIYAKKCAMCHGKQGEGNPSMAKVLGVTMRPLSAKGVQSKSDEQLRKDSIEGVGKMKPVQGLSLDDVGSLILHIRSLAQ